MSFSLTAIVLGAAAMHAVWNALVKKSSDRLIELTTLNLAAGAVALVSLFFVGLPGSASVPYLIVSFLFHVGYYAFLLLGYGRGELSLVYPIARGTSPLLVALTSAVLLQEIPTPLSLAGVVLIAAGIGSLALAGGLRSLNLRAVIYSLLTGVMIAGYSVTDGTGARVARSASAYIACFFALQALPLLVAAGVRERGLPFSRIRRHWRTGLIGGVLSMAAYGLAVWAMTRAPLALVSALRETSVVFAAAIGAGFLGDRFGRYRIVASIGVALGVVLLRLGG